MAASASIWFDAQEIAANWTATSTFLCLAIALLLIYPLVTYSEPDTHPFFLAHQSTASPVRQPGESAVYRSNELLPDSPLRSGGPDVDLTSIWTRVAETQSARILTVYGRQKVVDHNIGAITKEINIIGQHIQQLGSARVAVYLPNCIELLSTLFACAFYDATIILLPYDQSYENVIRQLHDTKADLLIAQAGSLALEQLTSRLADLKGVVWVVEESSRQMDWETAPLGDKPNIKDVTSWHKLVEKNTGKTTATLPSRSSTLERARVITVWLKDDDKVPDIVEFTQKNILAAVAALTTALPLKQRIGPSDMFLAADSFAHSFTLALTLVALYSGASLALTSVAGSAVDLPSATLSIAPTVIAASSETASRLLKDMGPSVTGYGQKLAHYLQARALSAGTFRSNSILARIVAPIQAAIGATPGKLRLLYVSEKAGSGNPQLSSADLSDLRIHCNARVVYALTASKVAGAVAQTRIFDYRRENEDRSVTSHFGAPLSCVEVKLCDTDKHKTTENGEPQGEIAVSGPSVVGGKVLLGVIGRVRDDNTLAYL